ncbi:hypothetical protein Trco_006205 [Trichoderma cornu-damae]|uniref:CENP-V/GFA domain-containing protein n=1 Tax=Trichoderma cornu-damae TaxID=654480 RepID=A0A9P8QKP9_9HYPO|nr:hypothetical protein Trco_006205 [Trichoderma cornu-damae]
MTDEPWKTQPPYQKPDQAFRKVLQGVCHCGKVKYWLSKDSPLASKYCHCNDCKVIHGNNSSSQPFSALSAVFSVFQKSDVAFQKGAENLRFYSSSAKSPDHELPCKVSCSHCGTPIMDEGRNMALLFPTLLLFPNAAQRKNFDVQCHIFYPQRVLDLPDGKPKWAGLDNKGNRVDET